MRGFQLACTGACGAEVPDVFENKPVFKRVLVDAVVTGIGNVDITFGADRDALRTTELRFAGAFGAKGFGQVPGGPFEFILVYAVVAGVGDPDVA